MTLRTIFRTFAVLLGLLIASPLSQAQLAVVGDGGPGPVKAQHLTAELVTLSPSIAPGGTLQAGLVITLEEHWHVYWINAGDSGEPPKITWTLPAGITAGPMQFPIPSRLPLGPLMDFGYEDTVAFPVQLSAAKSVKPGPIHLDAIVNWLVCREVCIPGKAHLGLNLQATPTATPPQTVGALGTALTLLPKPLPPSMKYTVAGGKTDFVVTLITGDTESDAEFYPFDQEQINNAADQIAEVIPNGIRIRVKRSEDLKTLPAQLHGLIRLSDTQAYDVTAPVVPGEVPVANPVIDGSKNASAVTTVTAIGLAFLGGIILNLMPCVFPVLFLKGLALVQSSGEDRSRLRSHGLVYTLGILVSFWVIVAALLVLRAGGSQAGWGFQLQSPTFIAVLAAGLFFFALSLAGQFDLGLSLTSVGGELAQKQGYTGSFFTGVLATIVATPCTAPLMGAAIGFALAQPAGITFAVFTALGLGLAAPYLLLSFNPAWTRLLPRPGAWMETLKQFTSIFLFGSAIWLAWVYGNLYSGGAASAGGVDHLARLLWCFLILAIAGWALGKWPAKWSSAITALVLAVIAIAIPLYQPKDTTLVWKPYTQQALDSARSSGHPVFIDFTAAWCLSCQVNERLVLKSAEVQKQFTAHNVTLLKADWTQYDPEITKQLAAVNRSGVPTYVIYPTSSQAMPDVLPEVLTKSIVVDALAKDLK
ncbi:thioredoxin family protein [Granulicella sp. dw_53]|uniref:protein-disulfide reductase DsbD family protein n=1 Tax=Granulicella sp. dw_53 TaxID=2719792 RepID=UPI001BD6BABB|nr:thioredoxin family protein [Granulicella sp. dw_53]